PYHSASGLPGLPISAIPASQPWVQLHSCIAHLLQRTLPRRYRIIFRIHHIYPLVSLPLGSLIVGSNWRDRFSTAASPARTVTTSKLIRGAHVRRGCRSLLTATGRCK